MEAIPPKVDRCPKKKSAEEVVVTLGESHCVRRRLRGIVPHEGAAPELEALPHNKQLLPHPVMVLGRKGVFPALWDLRNK